MSVQPDNDPQQQPEPDSPEPDSLSELCGPAAVPQPDADFESTPAAPAEEPKSAAGAAAGSGSGSADRSNLQGRPFKDLTQLSARQREKFQRFETNVIAPFAERLQQIDPASSVFVAGSHKVPARQIRLTSDLDLLVLSEVLNDGAVYVAALNDLRRSAKRYCRAAGADYPVFFTQKAQEMNFMERAMRASGGDYENVVPVHLLYYRNERELKHLEHPIIGTNVLNSAQAITRAHSPTVFTAWTEKVEPLEQARWDVERAVADFTLNRGLLPKSYLALEYAHSLNSALMMLGGYFPSRECSVDTVINVLDPQGNFQLREKFAPIQAIREGVLSIKKLRTEDYLAPALAALSSIDQLLRPQADS